MKGSAERVTRGVGVLVGGKVNVGKGVGVIEGVNVGVRVFVGPGIGVIVGVFVGVQVAMGGVGVGVLVSTGVDVEGGKGLKEPTPKPMRA